MNPNFDYEQGLLNQNYSRVGGLDEVGRGAWAGPIVAAIVVFPREYILGKTQTGWLEQVRDSKLLTTRKRSELAEFIKGETEWAIGECESQKIDELGIVAATGKAMAQALTKIKQAPDYLLIDGREGHGFDVSHETIVHGDNASVSIAAASIIAKVYRDELMKSYHDQYPSYGFDQHVGYGTKKHVEALKAHGLCAIHRISYKPVSQF